MLMPFVVRATSVSVQRPCWLPFWLRATIVSVREMMPVAYLMSATSVSVQKIMLVVPMTSVWVGGSLKMLANTYRGEVPTSPNMMPMALRSKILFCTHPTAAKHSISSSFTELAVV